MNAYEQSCWDRYNMWCKLIPEYFTASKNKKKRLKKEYKMQHAYCVNIIDDIIPTSITFDPCFQQASKPCSPKAVAAPRKGNENMYVEQNMTVTEKTGDDVRRAHFLREIETIFGKKHTELRLKFGIDTPKSPKTPKELVEWIKAGEYTFIKSYDPDAEDEEDNGWCRYEPIIHGFRWTKVKEDRKGYDAAYDTLHDEKKHFVNEIWAEVDPANFIKILEKFEKSKLH